MNNDVVQQVETCLRFQFTNRGILEQALNFPQTDGTSGFPNFTQLAFLGDAVLELHLREYLLQKREFLHDEIQIVRDTLASRHAHASVVQYLGLLKIFRALDLKLENSPRHLSQYFEALIGAMYIDQGKHQTHSFLTERINPLYPKVLLTVVQTNPCAHLARLLQKKYGVTPVFNTFFAENVFHTHLMINEVTYQKTTAHTWVRSRDLAATVFLEKLEEGNITLHR